MENANLNQVVDQVIPDSHKEKKDLPQFLSVLTILTFIGSGFGVIGSIYNLSTVDQQRMQIAELMVQIKNGGDELGFMQGLVDGMLIMLENIYLIQGNALFVAILCITGAILMRQLKKTGFYIYVVGCLLSIIIPVAVIGLNMMGIAILLGSITTISFIIMYGVNYKYLY